MPKPPRNTRPRSAGGPRPPSPPPPSRRPRPGAGGASPAGGPGAKFIARGVRLVYEDESLLIVDKDPGIVSAVPATMREAQGGRGAPRDATVFDVVKAYLRRTAKPRARRGPRDGETERGGRHRAATVWIIHRLDKDASGLLVFAKDAQTFSWLKEDFRAKRVHRLYYAVAEGLVGEAGSAGTRQSILPDESERPRFGGPARGGPRGGESEEGPGKLAVTHYRVVATGSDRTLVQVRLETGRKNQIRIHFAEMGHPLIGDGRFGARTNPIGRLALHAAELGITHPATGRSLRFTVPPPASFYRAVGMDPPAPAAPAKGDGAPQSAAASQQAASRAPAARRGASASDTSWEGVAEWYDQLLEGRGNDHYEQVILPGALRLLDVKPGMRVLDLACGQGILSRRLAGPPHGCEVIGVDASASLIQAARKRAEREGASGSRVRFEVCDAREIGPLGLKESGGVDAAVCVMALGNIDPLEPTFRGVAEALRPGGSFVWIITHPAFRAAGQTSWGWDEQQRKQYRRVDGYLSTGFKEIVMNPGKGGDVKTMTFHRPLQTYIAAMSKAGLAVERLEEWPSLRESTSGPRAAEENRARREIPLFLGVRGVKGASAV